MSVKDDVRVFAGTVWGRALMLTAMVCCLAIACSRNSKEDPAAEPVPDTFLKVDNQQFLDMNVYVIRSSQRIRLGMATGNSTTRMRIPSNLLFGPTPLRFQADPIGGTRQPVSQEINVSPGDEVILIIPP